MYLLIDFLIVCIESSTSDQEIKLTQSELEIYKSEKFTFGNIPETPPPSHLC